MVSYLLLFVQYLAKHSQANSSKGKGVPHRQNTRRENSPSIIKGDLSPSRKGESDGLLGAPYGSQGPHGLTPEPIYKLTDHWLQPALQPSAFGLQPSAFGIGLQPLQPSASAFGPQPLAFRLQPMCNVYGLYHNENILLCGRSPIFG